MTTTYSNFIFFCFSIFSSTNKTRRLVFSIHVNTFYHQIECCIWWLLHCSMLTRILINGYSPRLDSFVCILTIYTTHSIELFQALDSWSMFSCERANEKQRMIRSCVTAHTAKAWKRKQKMKFSLFILPGSISQVTFSWISLTTEIDFINQPQHSDSELDFVCLRFLCTAHCSRFSRHSNVYHKVSV